MTEMMSPRVGTKIPSVKTSAHKLEINKVRQLVNEDIDIDLGYYIHNKKLGEGM